MRNPKWHRDEIILALELYFRIEPGQIHARNPEIIELSAILNKLPIHEDIPSLVNFRNPNGVGLKLSNLLAIDPGYSMKGMKSYSKLDKEVFDEFHGNREELKKIAKSIKETISNNKLGAKLYRIGDDVAEEDFRVKEGKVVYKLHKHIERDSSINRKKKLNYFKENGRLDCEVCGFDFHKEYGELGKGFIECHHKKPLHEINGETVVSFNDLALVCSNCHRMLHRGLGNCDVEELKKQIKK